MISALKQRVTKNVVFRLVIAIAIIAGCVVFAGQSMLYFFSGPTPVEAGMDYDALEGQYVSFEAKYIIDEYVRQSEKNTDTNREKLKNIGYIVYFDEEGVFFGLERPASKESEMDAAIDLTWSWLNREIEEISQGQVLKGTWTPLTGRRADYYKEQISDDIGEDVLELALPYYIDTNQIGNTSVSALYVWMTVIAIAIVYLIYIMLRFAIGSHTSKLKVYLKAHPEGSMEQIESDFTMAVPVGKNVWVGRKWTVYISGIYAEIVENRQITWAYYYRRTGRHSESSLRVYTARKGMRSIPVSQDEAMEILKIYGQNQLHMVIGYTKELEKMYQKDYQGFLNLRYNRSDEELLAQREAAEGVGT